MKGAGVAMEFDGVTGLDQSCDHLDIFIEEEICVTNIDEDIR